MEQHGLWEKIERLAQEKHGKRAYLVLQLNGVSAATIQMLKHGYIPKRADTRKRIADALGVPEEELFGDAL